MALPEGLEATLALVRHGESTWIAAGRFQGRGDPPLSPRGERQAALVAARLATRDASRVLPLPVGPPVAIWHSPLERARATAVSIGAVQPQPPPLRPLAELTEIAQGAWEGLPSVEVAARWPELLGGWRRDPVHHHAPGGESLGAAARRVRDGLATILGELGGESGPAEPTDGAGRSFVPGYGTPAGRQPWSIVVAHDGIFRLMLLHLLGLPLGRFWGLPFVLCGISIVELRDGKAILRAHNLASHLDPITQGPERGAGERDARERGGAL